MIPGELPENESSIYEQWKGKFKTLLTSMFGRFLSKNRIENTNSLDTPPLPETETPESPLVHVEILIDDVHPDGNLWVSTGYSNKLTRTLEHQVFQFEEQAKWFNLLTYIFNNSDPREELFDRPANPLYRANPDTISSYFHEDFVITGNNAEDRELNKAFTIGHEYLITLLKLRGYELSPQLINNQPFIDDVFMLGQIVYPTIDNRRKEFEQYSDHRMRRILGILDSAKYYVDTLELRSVFHPAIVDKVKQYYGDGLPINYTTTLEDVGFSNTKFSFSDLILGDVD